MANYWEAAKAELGSDPSSVKRIEGEHTLLVVELGPTFWAGDDFEAFGKRIASELEAKWPGVKVLIVPHDVHVKALPVGAVYHREHLAGYTVEAVARTEEELRERLDRDRNRAKA